MANIVEGDVTCQVLWRKAVGQGSGATKMVDVGVKVTIDPGTTDAYPTGGIPLTTLFTTANGQNIDTGLDTTEPIFEMARGPVRKTGAVTPATPAYFYNGGITPASQTLVLLIPNGGVMATITGGTIAVASATSITDSANGFVTAGFKVGDIVAISGFTGGGAGTNGIARVTVVAAGALTVDTSSLTADAATETVTVTTIYRPVQVSTEYTNSDVTLAGGPTGGADTTLTYATVLRGLLRHEARSYRCD